MLKSVNTVDVDVVSATSVHQNRPHASLILTYLRGWIRYLARSSICMYSSGISGFSVRKNSHAFEMTSKKTECKSRHLDEIP